MFILIFRFKGIHWFGQRLIEVVVAIKVLTFSYVYEVVDLFQFSAVGQFLKFFFKCTTSLEFSACNQRRKRQSPEQSTHK